MPAAPDRLYERTWDGPSIFRDATEAAEISEQIPAYGLGRWQAIWMPTGIQISMWPTTRRRISSMRIGAIPQMPGGKIDFMKSAAWRVSPSAVMADGKQEWESAWEISTQMVTSTCL